MPLNPTDERQVDQVFTAVRAIHRLLDDTIDNEAVALSALQMALSSRVARMAKSPLHLDIGMATSMQHLLAQSAEFYSNPDSMARTGL